MQKLAKDVQELLLRSLEDLSWRCPPYEVTEKCFDCEGMTHYADGRRYKRLDPCETCNSTGRVPQKDERKIQTLALIADLQKRTK